jgi:hypothetical protein
MAFTQLARCDQLLAEGRPIEAIDTLTEANRLERDPEIERRLIGLRHEAFASIDRSSSPEWPVVAPGAALTDAGPPAIAPAELTAETLSTGILRHGCLHVRGLVPEAEVERLVDGIDRAFAAYDAHAAGAPVSETTPWFEPFKPGADYRFKLNVKRQWVRKGGGVWTADSPRMMFDLFNILEATGLTKVITAYLGERPALSVDKSTLRRVGELTGTDWHQDGAFLGEGIRTVNVWLSLSHCGRDAPGLDVVPSRLDRVLETGTESAIFPWAVAPEVVARAASETGVVRPVFAPGDVLLFDDLFLHRTAYDETMTRERYAVENWFFAPSVYPDTGQIPLAF